MPNRLFTNHGAGLPGRLASSATRELFETHQWQATPLGAATAWPESLLTTARMIFAAETPMVMLVGPEGHLVYNDGYADFAGSRHPAIFGVPATEAWPEIADFNREVMRRVYAGESYTLYDQRLDLNRRGTIEPLWLNLGYSPVTDGTGAILAVLVIVQEVTKQIEAEHSLRASEERLSFALEGAGLVGTWDWNIPDNTVRADQRFAEMYGVDPAEAAAGTPIERFVDGIHPDDREEVTEKINAAIAARGRYRAEYRLQDRGGGIRWVLALGAVRSDANGQPVRLPGVAIDISDRKEIETALASSEAKFRAIADTMPQMVWSTRPDGYHDYYNARWYEYTGMPVGSTDGEEWNGVFHPDDRERAWAAWRHSLETGDPYQIEYRLRNAAGEYRWTLGRALPIRDAGGKIVRWFGTCTDIHETRLMAEEREVVAQELSHRIKNIFSVLTGIIGLSARNYPQAREFADQLRERISALGKAHDFVRPHSRQSRPERLATTLHGLIRELLAAYDMDGAGRIRFEGDDPVVDDAAATPLALLFHELATNAAKYGALSSAGGTVTVRSAVADGTCHITWEERGGPSIEGAPSREGFGSRLMQLSIQGQMAGRLERRWDADGLTVAVDVPETRLRRA